MTEPAFDDLARELQAARPRASDELRERVLTLARAEPVRERRRFRIAPYVVPALGAATVVAFVAIGVTSLRGTDSSEQGAAGAGATAAVETPSAEAADEDAARSAAPNVMSQTAMGTRDFPLAVSFPSGQRTRQIRVRSLCCTVNMIKMVMRGGTVPAASLSRCLPRTPVR